MINDSLIQLIDKAMGDRTQNSFALHCGISPSTITLIRQGKMTPKPTVLKKIAAKAYGNVTYNDLMIAAGHLQQGSENLDISRYKNILPISTHRVPLLGKIACGKPIYADEDRESYVEAGTNIKADFCVQAQGDSMINARIHSGDIVFIRAQEMVDNGEIAAVLIDDEVTLKRVYYYPNKSKLILQAENPVYEPLVYTDEELDTIRILGKAIAFQSDVK